MDERRGIQRPGAVRRAVTRGVSPGLFGVVALCFLLPFVSLTCTGDGIDRRILTLTGVDLVTGRDWTPREFGEGLFGDVVTIPEDARTIPEGPRGDIARMPVRAPAIAALAAALAGVATVFLRTRLRPFVATMLAVAGGVAVSVLKFDVDRELGRSEAEAVSAVLEYRVGYWAALGLFVALALGNTLALVRAVWTSPVKRETPPRGSPTGQ